MSSKHRWASSFSIEDDKMPKQPEITTLILDVRTAIPSPAEGYKNEDHKRRYVLGKGKSLLALAEKHLAQNPDGHVAFGCRLGHDRSVTLAAELNRRMAAKESK